MSGAIALGTRPPVRDTASLAAAIGAFFLEALEPRRLFSGPVIAVTFADGIVSVHGTAGRDLINIQQLVDWNGGPTIELTYQSYSHGSDGGFGIAGGVAYFSRSAIKEIHFDGGGGDDIAYCQNIVGNDDLPVVNVDVPLFLDGGDGDDTLLGGAGDDTIIGGAGKDWIEAGAIPNAYALNFSYWTGSDNGLKAEQFTADANGNMVGGSAGHDLLVADAQPVQTTTGGSAITPAQPAGSIAGVPPTSPVATPALEAASSGLLKDKDGNVLV